VVGSVLGCAALGLIIATLLLLKARRIRSVAQEDSLLRSALLSSTLH
jgi:hypothetical protein